MRNTLQKDAVLSAVLESCDHPDVENIYLRSKKILPSISIATVYRALSVLYDENKILKIPCPSGDRYDKTLHPHAHFRCLNCGEVTDIHSVNVADAVKQAESERKITIQNANVLFTGICEKC